MGYADPYDADDMANCRGYLEFIRYDSDDNGFNNVIKFKDNPNLYFTRATALFEPLFDILLRNYKIQLITNSCIDGNHGFATVQILGGNV